MGHESSRQRIVCIVGPTACHKTECSIELAKRVRGEIVSADSVQVYFGMDVGSAKPTLEERQGIPHHLIDCLPIDAPEFSVSMFRDMAAKAVGEIAARGHTPIVVGGSGLYVNALTYPLGFAIPRNEEVRARVCAEYDANPAAAYARLQKSDPNTAKRLHPNDKKRVVRALEVHDCSDRTFSSYGGDFQNDAGELSLFDPLMIGLNMEREALYGRINLRVEQMMRRGLLDEARRIYDAGYDRSIPAMRSIGYRQLFAYFDGDCTLADAVEQIKQDTRRFGKRQLTWFRRDGRIRWHDVTNWNETKDALLAELTRVTLDWMEGIQQV
ncbi:MAG: tRNA (adenosine(37)-N6)-dimethylallyltransferase MiaA [Clostridiales bacterium]|nr:tRNA (adenosine(37)-N6)-dimethylallyltransferase MiaA [Clostridiales bacterium]